MAMAGYGYQMMIEAAQDRIISSLLDAGTKESISIAVRFEMRISSPSSLLSSAQTRPLSRVSTQYANVVVVARSLLIAISELADAIRILPSQ